MLGRMVPHSCDNNAISAPSWGLAGWLGLSLAIILNFQCQDYPGAEGDLTELSVPTANQVIMQNGDGSTNQKQVTNFACQYCDKLFTVWILLL